MDDTPGSATASLTNHLPAAPAARWGTVMTLGVCAVSLLLMRRRPHRRGQDREASVKRAALRAYLEDHLAGSDAAFRVVARMRVSHQGTREGELCAALHREFTEERNIVQVLLADLGGPGVSVKRMVGRAT